MSSTTALPTLAPEQLSSFEKDGFLHIPAKQHGLVKDASELQR